MMNSKIRFACTNLVVMGCLNGLYIEMKCQSKSCHVVGIKMEREKEPSWNKSISFSFKLISVVYMAKVEQNER